MSIESVKYADSIILDTFKNGLTIPDTKNNSVVESRLRIFGYWEGRAYYLNERGIEYAMKGCSKGIIEKQVKDDFINDLNIEATKKAMNDADRAFIQSEKSLSESKIGNKLAKWALGISIASVIFQMLEHILRGLL